MTNQDLDIFYKQAMSYMGQGETKKAIEFFNKVLEIDEMYSPAWNDKGVAYLELKEYTKALDCFERVIFLNPSVSMPFYNKGYVQMMLEKYEDSVKTFDSFLANYPFKDDFYKYALYLKAKGHYSLGEYKDAKKLLKKAVDKDKNFNEAQELLKLISDEKDKTI
jgi:lipoprotein NlpI